MYYVIFGLVALVAAILLVITIFYNKFKFAIIKIEEAENNIDILFDKKIELLERTRPIIKKELKLKEFLDDIEFLSETKINHFEMNESLRRLHSELNNILDEHDKLYKSEALVNIIDEIKSANIEAMKNKDSKARAIYSVLMNKFLLAQVDARTTGKEVEDADMVRIIQKTIKELEEERDNYARVNNTEEVENIEYQKSLIEKYLPQMMSEDEIKAEIKAFKYQCFRK